MATTQDISLAYILLKYHYGNQTAVVAKMLLEQNKLTLSELHKNLPKIELKNVKKTLAILVQHKFVEFFGDLVLKSSLKHKKQNIFEDDTTCKPSQLVLEKPIQYSVNLKNVMNLANYPRILADSEKMMSGIARLILTDILSSGKVQASKTINKIQNQSNHPFTSIKSQFIFLAKNLYLLPSVVHQKNYNHLLPEENGQDPENDSMRTSALTVLSQINEVKVKDVEITEPNPKNMKFEMSDLGQNFFQQPTENKKNIDDGLYWTCNFRKWNQLHTQNVISSSVALRFDKKAADIVEVLQILSLNHYFNFNNYESLKQTWGILLSDLRRNDLMKHRISNWGVSKMEGDMLLLEYMNVLTKDVINPNNYKESGNNNTSWLFNLSGSIGDDNYSVNIFNILQWLVLEYICRVSTKVCSKNSSRIIRILFEKNFTDIGTLKVLTMYEEKDLVNLLIDLISKHLIVLQVLPKRPGFSCDYTFNQSQYIYGLNLEQSARYFFEICKSTFCKLEIKRSNLKVKIQGLIDKKVALTTARNEAKQQEMNENIEESDFIELTKEENVKLEAFYKKDKVIKQHKLLLTSDMTIFEAYLNLVPRNNKFEMNMDL